MIMREKNIAMRITNWWYEKNINFCEKMMMREINKWNLKAKNEKETHKFKKCTLHFTIENKLYS